MTLENLMQKIRGGESESEEIDVSAVPDDLSGLDPGDLLDADPRPARTAPRTSMRKERGPARQPEKLSVQAKRKISDMLVMMITLPGGMIAMRDPVCGGALVTQARPIADAMVPIIARNPAMLRWFLDGGGFMDYFALLMALQPVGMAVWGHHVAGVGHEPEGGRPDAAAYTIPDF